MDAEIYLKLGMYAGAISGISYPLSKVIAPKFYPYLKEVGFSKRQVMGQIFLFTFIGVSSVAVGLAQYQLKKDLKSLKNEMQSLEKEYVQLAEKSNVKPSKLESELDTFSGF